MWKILVHGYWVEYVSEREIRNEPIKIHHFWRTRKLKVDRQSFIKYSLYFGFSSGLMWCNSCGWKFVLHGMCLVEPACLSAWLRAWMASGWRPVWGKRLDRYNKVATLRPPLFQRDVSHENPYNIHVMLVFTGNDKIKHACHRSIKYWIWQ